nr:VOC family protein [Allomuricauda sp.]|tara:strand:- start:3749 stop:4129 length:381 start_codon:yes stop_codon:yes gene_type:complete
MKNNLSHFAIYIDDIDRAKGFYSNLFGWDYNSYGQDDFLQIKDSAGDDGKLIGALQSRNYSPIKEKIIGFECSISVSDIDEIIEKIESNNGKIVMPKTEIPYVGWLVKFLDTEGNIVCAVQYHNQQ